MTTIHLALKDGNVACGAHYNGMMAIEMPRDIWTRGLAIANNDPCGDCLAWATATTDNVPECTCLSVKDGQDRGPCEIHGNRP